MDWYLMVWKKYAQFSGRSRRKEYWMFALFNCLFCLPVYIAGLLLRENAIGIILLGLYVLYCLAIIVPSLAVTVRRLHDTGKSGWMILLGLIPIVGGIIVFVFTVLDSDPGPNEYGPNPKFPELAGMAAGNPGYPSMGLGAPPLTEDQKATIERLLRELGNENNIEGRILATEQLGAEKQFGDIDVPAALLSAGKHAVMQFEAKRMGIAVMHGVMPHQISVMPHADDSRVTSAVVSTLRKLASRKDATGIQAKAALADMNASLRSAEIRTKVGL